MAYINVDEVYILDNTGLQVDMATDIPFADAGFTDTQKEQARANIAAGGTNPNLLDNPWFTVRQRGDGPFIAPNYTADRWKLTAGSASISFSDNGATITPNGSYLLLTQYTKLPTTLGTITASIKISGVVYSVTGNAATGFQLSLVDVWGSGRIEVAVSGGYLNFIIGASTAATFEAVKLELGSVSTLANDAPPDYGTELLKCMRYFVRLNYTSVAEPIGYGYAYAASQARILIPTPVPMRADPTISASATANLRINSNGTYITPSGFTATGTAFPNGIAVHFGISGATSGALTLLFSYDAMYIDFSADL